ncbi:CaiB/BaiF CoA transferase family protein [Roseiterribacter gracilis]|uniref:CoA transferase n=1 Tax=Roseiterribacter gracilis TaxID=2812848 RepID=A0A8S8XG83_9PROT|nr:CoA transferase [Rhodospirillales bacterium TMPK1]
MTSLPKPLDGITVIDTTVALAGPYATLLLAGLGARVIKVENPLSPDPSRSNVPYLGKGGAHLMRDSDDDISISALNRLRNKQGVTLNLKHADGKRIFGELLRQADVVVENFSHGTMEKLGVGYSFAREVNPRIVYCSITGFGAQGEPGSGKAMDAIIQALSGVMHTSGAPEDPPIRVGFPLADLSAPLFGVIGILAALFQARSTGIGQHVDVSMLGVLTSMVATEPYDILERFGIPMRTGQTVPRLAPFGVYRTRDGHVAVCAPTDTFARGVFAAMDQAGLANDARFVTRDLRVQNVAALEALIEPWALSLAAQDMVDRLARNGVPAAVVRDPSAAVRDPLLLERGETVRLSHPKFGQTDEVYGPGLPIRFSESASGFDQPPPGLGEHNQAIYGDLLGYRQDEIERLQQQGVI